MIGRKTDGTPFRVLAVDDSPITRKMLRKALEPEGFEIVGEASNGKEALALYLKLKPDLITMDITMPIMDGLSAAGRIKKLNPNQRIVMLSAMGDDNLVNQARALGVDGFCSKPIKNAELLKVVSDVIGK